MSTTSILSILVYPQSGHLLVYPMGLSLVHCSYLSIGSLQEPRDFYSSQIPPSSPPAIASRNRFSFTIQAANLSSSQSISDCACSLPLDPEYEVFASDGASRIHNNTHVTMSGSLSSIF